MRWHEPITLKVKILSPVAIGTGEKCNTLGFVADDGKVLVVDERKFLRSLNESQLNLLLKWLEGEKGRTGLLNFLRKVLQVQRPAQWLSGRKAVRYEVAAIAVPNRDFSLCIKTPDHRPYIPGSEIKGAIRTAVLSAMLNEGGLDQLVGKLNEKIMPLLNKIAQIETSTASASRKGREETKSQKLRKLIRQTLGRVGQQTEWALVRRDQDDKDAHNDLFRGIAISDSEPLPTNSLRIYAAKRLNMKRDVTVFVETIAPNNETKVTLSIAHPDRWLAEIGLADKSGWLDWGKLAQALYEHSNLLLDFIAQKFPQIRQRVQVLKNQNQPDAPLVHIGWGQGFLSVTMTEPLLKLQPNAYETLRQAMAKGFSQYGRTKPNNFPKTIWVALDRNNQPADLFGWVKLIRK